ncbi:MAG TPA: cupin domain-containing protein [Acidimicrobiales bacterium]|nr:cupin domain-containing protein [Acidimicrobiales bacterium]
MPRLLPEPIRIEAAGTPTKLIDEHVGLMATGDDRVSIAVMHSPQGWSEPAQAPDFDEWTLVLAGVLHVEHDGGTLTVAEGQTVHVPAGEQVRYSTPDGATEYISVCLPAFSPQRVHRVE